MPDQRWHALQRIKGTVSESSTYPARSSQPHYIATLIPSRCKAVTSAKRHDGNSTLMYWIGHRIACSIRRPKKSRGQWCLWLITPPARPASFSYHLTVYSLSPQSSWVATPHLSTLGVCRARTMTDSRISAVHPPYRGWCASLRRLLLWFRHPNTRGVGVVFLVGLGDLACLNPRGQLRNHE